MKRLLQVPYFGKIGVTFEDSPEEPENFYIGVNDFTSLEEAAHSRLALTDCFVIL